MKKKHLPLITAPKSVKKGGHFKEGRYMSRVEDTVDNFKICMQGNCSACPSYPKKSGEGLYCARGPSKKAIEKRGCNCPECPLWADAGLSGMYYCVK